RSNYHPHLLSFPTRRSSDLLRVDGRRVIRDAGLVVFAGNWEMVIQVGIVGTDEDPRRTSGPRHRDLEPLLCAETGGGVAGIHGTDRKSTRLNSSHVAISYAV